MKIEVAVGMPRFRLTFFLFLIFVFSIPSPKVWAEEATVPHYLNFQSVLRDDGGNLITDSFIDLEFRIVDAEGQELYHELQPGVQVIRGVTNVMIGEGLIPGSDPARPTGGLPPEVMDPASGQKFLEVKIGDNRPSDPIELGMVPYAAWSENALHVAPDSIGSEQIKNGSIKLEDLEPGLSFSNVSGQISPSQIPTTVATDDEVNAGIQTLSSLIGQEAANRSTADASESAARASADSTEASARAAADTNLQNQITAHQGATSAHGTTGAIVGTTDTQTLSNKTLESSNLHGATLSGDLALDHAKCQTESGHRCLLDGIDLRNLANGQVPVSRLDTDVATQAELDGEVSARTAAEGQVQQQLATEAANRSTADASESAARASADSAEASARAAADTNLQNQITVHQGATSAHGTTGAIVGTTDTQTLSNKTLEGPDFHGATLSGDLILDHARCQSESGHRCLLDGIDLNNLANGQVPVSRLDTDVATQAELYGEVSARMAAEDQVQQQLATEAATRAGEDRSLEGSVNTTNANLTGHINQTVAHGSDGAVVGLNTLNSSIATHSATPLATAHPNGTFPIARLDTDIATQAELDGEASVRLTTDNGLQGQINTTNTNFTNHLNADIATAHPTGRFPIARLDTDIATQAELDGEVSARTAAEDQVQQQLATEAATRAGEDRSLEGSVNTTNANLTGHINQTVAHGSNGAVVGLNTLNSSIATHSATPLGTAHPNGTFPIARLDTDIATQAELDGEAASRISADAGLQSSIEGDLATEAATRASADRDLQYQVDNRVRGMGDTMIGDLYFDQSQCLGRLGRRCRVDGVEVGEVGAEVARLTSIAAGLDDINNIPGVLSEGKIDPSLVRDSEFQSADAALENEIAQEAGTRASADRDLQYQVDNRVRGTGDTMIGDLYFDQSQCLSQLGRRCRVDGVEVGAEVARLTSIAADLDDINNIPGVLSAGKIDSSVARDGEFQAADAVLEGEIAQEAGTRASADRDLERAVDNRVRGTGDTMIGDLYFDQSQCLGRFGRHCRVDGVDIATEVARLESIVAGLNDINNIPGVLSAGKIDDTIARDSEIPPPPPAPSQSPSSTGPFAFGTIRLSGTGVGTITNSSNMNTSRVELVGSGGCSGSSMTGRRVFFYPNQPLDSNYVVLVTGVGVSGLGNPPSAYVLAKSGISFDLCVPSSLQQADFVVFRP